MTEINCPLFCLRVSQILEWHPVHRSYTLSTLNLDPKGRGFYSGPRLIVSPFSTLTVRVRGFVHIWALLSTELDRTALLISRHNLGIPPSSDGPNG